MDHRRRRLYGGLRRLVHLLQRGYGSVPDHGRGDGQLYPIRQGNLTYLPGQQRRDGVRGNQTGPATEPHGSAAGPLKTELAVNICALLFYGCSTYILRKGVLS